MQATSSTLERAVDLYEPVRHVLRQKDAALWCTSPDSTVYDAIEEMSKRHIGSLVVLSGGKLAGAQRSPTGPFPQNCFSQP